MDDLLLELIAELLAPLAYALGAALLTGVGLLAELSALQSASSGELGLGLWFTYVGAVALYVGLYVLGHQRLLPLVRRAGAAGE